MSSDSQSWVGLHNLKASVLSPPLYMTSGSSSISLLVLPYLICWLSLVSPPPPSPGLSFAVPALCGIDNPEELEALPMGVSSLLILLSQQVPGAASPAQGLPCLAQSPGQPFPLISHILPWLGQCPESHGHDPYPPLCAAWLSHSLPPSRVYL